ncbi:MAG: T9SS type A sorting domain-containing protein, partial [Crocinitomicaceae bacterium]
SNFTDTIGYIQQENFEWIERSVNLSELGYDDQTIHIAFVLRTYDGFKLYLDDILVTKEDDASISENRVADVVIYPNPCQDILHIQSETFTEQVLILDLSGKLVMKSTSNVINVESLQKGSYMVRVFTNRRVINQPVYIR